MFLGSRLHSIEDKDRGGVGDGHLGGTLLWGGRGLGRGAGGGRGGGGTFQGTQSLAEPGVLRCLDLVHQDATLVLQLLEGCQEKWRGGGEVNVTSAEEASAHSCLGLLPGKLANTAGLQRFQY